MPLDKSEIVDAFGIEKDTGVVVLTIADEWDWKNEGQHLLALQAKLNAYFHFIESGQILREHPDACGRNIVIDLITRFPLSRAGRELLNRAEKACADLGIQIRSREYRGGQ
jgi:hypothetical protein